MCVLKIFNSIFLQSKVFILCKRFLFWKPHRNCVSEWHIYRGGNRRLLALQKTYLPRICSPAFLYFYKTEKTDLFFISNKLYVSHICTETRQIYLFCISMEETHIWNEIISLELIATKIDIFKWGYTYIWSIQKNCYTQKNKFSQINSFSPRRKL